MLRDYILCFCRRIQEFLNDNNKKYQTTPKQQQQKKKTSPHISSERRGCLPFCTSYLLPLLVCFPGVHVTLMRPLLRDWSTVLKTLHIVRLKRLSCSVTEAAFPDRPQPVTRGLWVLARLLCLNSLSKFTGSPPFYNNGEEERAQILITQPFSVVELTVSSAWCEESWDSVLRPFLRDGSWLFKRDKNT